MVSGEIEQLVAGEITRHVAPPGLAVTVYEVGAPPPTPGATVIVALESAAVTDEMVGALGGAMSHCAITVKF